MKIYTKTGDDGTTALFDGSRVQKSHNRVDLYGEVDELNSTLGLAISFLQKENAQLKPDLIQIQNDLFALGAKLANPKQLSQKEKSDFQADKVIDLEAKIDNMDAKLEALTTFILAGGTNAASFLHLARTQCRRTERKMIAFHQQEALDEVYLKYVNRLSDYLFTVARYANFLCQVEDIKWQ